MRLMHTGEKHEERCGTAVLKKRHQEISLNGYLQDRREEWGKVMENEMSDYEKEAKHKLLDAITSVCQSECRKRCPEGRCHCDRCKHCDCQFVFSQAYSWVKINSDKLGVYTTFREIFENEHRQDFRREY